MYVICCACMLCGIFMVGCDFYLANVGYEKFDSGNVTLALFFIALSGWGIYKLNKDDALEKRLANQQ